MDRDEAVMRKIALHRYRHKMHTPQDGRGARNVYVDGVLVKNVLQADQFTGEVRYRREPNMGLRVLRGDVRVEFLKYPTADDFADACVSGEARLPDVVRYEPLDSADGGPAQKSCPSVEWEGWNVTAADICRMFNVPTELVGRGAAEAAPVRHDDSEDGKGWKAEIAEELERLRVLRADAADTERARLLAKFEAVKPSTAGGSMASRVALKTWQGLRAAMFDEPEVLPAVAGMAKGGA